MALLPVKRSRGQRESSSLARFHDEIDELFKDMFGQLDWPSAARTHWPVIDIAEDEEAFTVNAEVPGCKAEDIDISVHGNTLRISGEKKQEKEEEKKGFYHVERSYGTFQRELNLSSSVDPEQIDAKCKDGILTIKLPKKEKTKPVKINVKGE